MDSDNNCLILKLPEEILLQILSYHCITAKSLQNFGECCKKFHNFVQDPILWKRKLQSRYPKSYETILLHGTEDYLEQYKYVHQREIQILTALNETSPRFFGQRRDPKMEDSEVYFSICGERNISLACVHSILVDIHTKSAEIIKSDYPSTTPYSLTVQYYATFAIRYLMHMYLMMNWRAMEVTLPEISPERVLNFYVNWMHPLQFVDYTASKNELNNLFNEVKHELPPRHPTLLVTEQTRDTWIDGALTNNQWSQEDNLAVHSAIKHVLYTKREFKLDESLTPAALNIPLVLKKKRVHAIVLSVMYEALARRCGVKCVIIAFPDHYFLQWREDFTQTSTRYNVNLATGKLEKRTLCPFAPAEPSDQLMDYNSVRFVDWIIEKFRIQLDIDRNASLIFNVKSLDDMLHDLGLAQNPNINYRNKYRTLVRCANQLMADRPMSRFENMEEQFRRLMLAIAIPPSYVPVHEPPVQSHTVYRNHRSTQVQFAVGMVCGHRIYNYTCVVTGWHTSCAAPSEWQQRMGVNALMYKAQQPFYNVYATDGTSRYVAQENLNLLLGQRPRSIEDVIGKMFSHFNGTYYIPNKEKQKEYPDENLVIAAYRRAPTLLSQQNHIPYNLHQYCWFNWPY